MVKVNRLLLYGVEVVFFVFFSGYLLTHMLACAPTQARNPVTYQESRKELIVGFKSHPSDAVVMFATGAEIGRTPCSTTSSNCFLSLLRRDFSNGKTFILLQLGSGTRIQGDTYTWWGNSPSTVKKTVSTFECVFTKDGFKTETYKLTIYPDQLPELWNNPYVTVSAVLEKLEREKASPKSQQSETINIDGPSIKASPGATQIKP